MARSTRPKAQGKARTNEASATISGVGAVSAKAEVIAAQEIDRIIERLDVGIAAERKAMEALLSRLLNTRIAA
jgi:hypothetical protein